MRRLRLLVLVIVLAIHGLIDGVAEAQRASRPVRIGALTESWGPTPALVALRDGLQELGYRENEHFVIGVRFTQGNRGELPGAARDLVRGGADIIVTDGAGDAAKAAQIAVAGRIPIVFMGGSDPVGRGLVQSFARPGGNITGIADLDIELGPKRLELLREMMPALKRVWLPYDVADGAAPTMLAAHRDAARRLGVTLLEKPLRTEEEARAAVAEIRKGKVDGVLSPRWLALNIPGFLLEASTRLPVMFYSSFFVERGGLASYAAGGPILGRQAARLVDKILKGTKPGDLPVEQPTKIELVINMKTAKALGLTIPPSVLLRADRVIE